MSLSDYEKAMLIMQRAQVRLAFLAIEGKTYVTGAAANETLREMDKQLSFCGRDVLCIVSPRAGDPTYSNG